MAVIRNWQIESNAQACVAYADQTWTKTGERFVEGYINDKWIPVGRTEQEGLALHVSLTADNVFCISTITPRDSHYIEIHDYHREDARVGHSLCGCHDNLQTMVDNGAISRQLAEAVAEDFSLWTGRTQEEILNHTPNTPIKCDPLKVGSKFIRKVMASGNEGSNQPDQTNQAEHSSDGKKHRSFLEIIAQSCFRSSSRGRD